MHHDREVRIERTPDGAAIAFGEPVDTRLAAIHQTLDQMTRMGLSTLTARMALLEITDEMMARERVRPARAD
jgi:hypothetical protein